MNEHPSPESILQVGLGFWPSKVLLSAVEMELFTDLAKGPQSLESIQGRLGLHPRAARDFLDSLVALGFLLRAGGRVFQHSGHRYLPRQTQALLHRRHPRNGEPSPIRLLESPHRSAANRPAAERSPQRRCAYI